MKYPWVGFPIVCAAITACGGGGSGGGTAAPLLTETQPRVKSISYDFSQDESIDRIDTYTYDEMGRVISVNVELLGDLQNGAGITQYEYSDDGLIRVTDSDSGLERLIGYDNGWVSTITNSNGERLTFRYNNAGRLIEMDTSESACDDLEPAQSDGSTFEYRYDGDLLTSVSTTDGAVTSAISYNARNAIVRLVNTDTCSTDNEETDELVITYDSQGLPSSIDDRGFYNGSLEFHDETTIQRDALGRTETITERDVLTDTVTETRTRVYGDDGLPASDSLVYANTGSFFLRQDVTLTFTYEDASCVLSYSVDPSRLAVLDAVLPSTGFAGEEALLCGYPLD
jgi:YD repeat-containing protein